MILKVCQHGQVERCAVHAFSADKITNGPGDSDMHPHIVETIVNGVQISLWRAKPNGMLFADWQALKRDRIWLTAVRWLVLDS
ncbi:hypothetical protein [Paraburkholderia largidicola]|uniref:Uncharacterized protein n=1 Tax=Paraburkholderia largidicola TaxID=3014751 RepID=A0A7I8C2X5_9BURK|nr:hypothetical protein [Paraburkholderia sp. PGU16]BCF95193.1 hypothetical protein PPGU16_82600 [Paraburkholderia sp. PGU16]